MSYIKLKLKQARNYYGDAKLDKVYTDEDALQADAEDMLKLCSIPYIRVLRATRRGISDLICCVDGQFVAIELKDDKGEASAPQVRFLNDISKAGGIIAEARTLREVLTTLEKAR